MIFDALTLVSNAQAVTASAVSTNTIDLSQARDIGAGNEVCFGVTVDESFATATSVESSKDIMPSLKPALRLPEWSSPPNAFSE